MKITLLYQGTKTKKYNELGLAKLLCYKRILLYIYTSCYNIVPLFYLKSGISVESKGVYSRIKMFLPQYTISYKLQDKSFAGHK